MTGKLLWVLLVVSAFASYANEEAHPEHDHSAHNHEHEHEHAERGVEVSEAAAELIGLKTVRSESRVIDAVISVPARVVVNPSAARTVSAKLSGFLRYSKVAPCLIGAEEELFYIVSPEAAAKYAELEAMRERIVSLDSVGAKNAQLKAEFAIIRGGFAALTNGLESVSLKEGEYLQRAGVKGRLNAIAVPSGSYVERGTVLASVTAMMGPSVVARISAADAKGIEDGCPAEVAGISGKLFVDRTAGDGLIDVRFDFADASAPVEVGERTMLVIRKVTEGKPVVAVPTRAIFRDGLETVVLVRDEDDEDRFVVHPVNPGRSANGWTEVVGFEEGEEVVVDGLYELRQALPGRGGEKKAAGHFHADGKFHEGGHDGE